MSQKVREVSYNPKVCLDPKVYYKTQSSTFDRLMVGKPLTDERIEYYEAIKRGEDPTKKRKSTASNKARVRTITKDLLADLGLL